MPLYTPAEAADLLAVRESWLRRRATARAVPCTFLGKHLRFSPADLVAIARAGATPTGPPPRPGRSPLRRRPARRYTIGNTSGPATSALSRSERSYPVAPTRNPLTAKDGTQPWPG
ncbi:MAG: helix-turn-helix domain-containing protein [Catenulispora sp.]